MAAIENISTSSGITMQMLDALAFLARCADHGELVPSGGDLAEYQGRSDEANARTTLRKLADKGLWTRTPFEITSAGRRLLSETLEMIDEARPIITHTMLRPSPLNPRKTFDELQLIELSRSIRERNLIHPIVVRPIGTGAYEIAAGERRWRAIDLLIMDPNAEEWTAETALKVDIRHNLSDADMLEIALSENSDRVDPHPLDEANGYAELVDMRTANGGKKSKVVAGIAQRLGVSARYVEIRVQIARKLIDECKAAFSRNEINFTQAMELSRAEPETQTAILSSVQRGEEGYRTQRDIMARVKAIEEAQPLPIEEPVSDAPAELDPTTSPPKGADQSAESTAAASLPARVASSPADPAGAQDADGGADLASPDTNSQQDESGEARPVHACTAAQDLLTGVARELGLGQFKLKITLEEGATATAVAAAKGLLERIALEAASEANRTPGMHQPNVTAGGRVLMIGA